MDRERFLAELERQRKYSEGRSSLYEALCAALARDLGSGEAFWSRRLFKAWEGREFTTWYEAPLVLLGTLHCHALRGDDALKPWFPSCGGAAAEGAPEAVLAWLGSAPAAFWEAVKDARLQTNEVSRSIAWLLPACVAFLGQRLPFHLVDLGCSAGLNLIGDYLERSWVLKSETGEPLEDPPHYRDVPFPVLSRTGLDRRPRRLEDPDDRLWLKACIWPDDAARHERFDRAADLLLKLTREQGGPRLYPCDFAEMPAWAASRIKPHPEEGLLLFNSQAADFLTDAQYAAFRAGIEKALAPWGERGLWVELEMPRGQSDAFHELRAHRLREGRLESRTLASLTAHPKEVRLLPGWDFLAPREPVKRRFTIEEPVKEMKPGRYSFPVKGDEPGTPSP